MRGTLLMHEGNQGVKLGRICYVTKAIKVLSQSLKCRGMWRAEQERL